MTRNLFVCAALGWAWLGCVATAGMAQDPILSELYGSGVHEYFCGGYGQAIADLSAAVDGGTKDPRVYYFRALTWWRLGDTPRAQMDLLVGAKLESADVNQYYPVSKSLERVQGAGRLMLERYRVQARAEAYRRQQLRNLARYEAQRKAEAEVLRATPIPPAPGEIAPGPADAKPAAEEPAAMAPGEEPDPFADDPDASGDAEKMPEKEAPPAADAESKDAATPEDEMPEAESSEDDAAADEAMKDSDADGMDKDAK